MGTHISKGRYYLPAIEKYSAIKLISLSKEHRPGYLDTGTNGGEQGDQAFELMFPPAERTEMGKSTGKSVLGETSESWTCTA